MIIFTKKEQAADGSPFLFCKQKQDLEKNFLFLLKNSH